jgi:hypothetical protein
MILGHQEDHRMNAAAIASIGIDLDKTTFHLVALDSHARVIVRKRFSRPQLLAYTANLPWSLIGMEACSGPHFIDANLKDQGHEAELIPRTVCETLLEVEQKRLHRCQSDWRSRYSSQHALCSDQDGRRARSSGIINNEADGLEPIVGRESPVMTGRFVTFDFADVQPEPHNNEENQEE